MNSEEWEQIKEEFGYDAYKRFELEATSPSDDIDNSAFFVRLKPIHNLFSLDVEWYGDNSNLMWEWQYKDRVHLDEWFKCDKPVNFRNPKIIYQRKTSAALPFDLERAMSGDVVQCKYDHRWFDCTFKTMMNDTIAVVSSPARPSDLVGINKLRMKYPTRK